MVISKERLAKIKEIIDKHYNRLTISVLGNSVFSTKELLELKKLGLDTANPESFLELAYMHNFISEHGKTTNPVSVDEMVSQQKIPNIKPVGEAHDYTVEHLNENSKHLIDKLKQDVSFRIESVIRDNNHNYKFNALMNLDRPDEADEIVKESTLGKVKQELRDYSKDANRNWGRIVRTEISNAVGAGSVDRIVTDNKEADIEDIYVYRINPNDGATCKFCRRFYIDEDGSPKVYRLSTILQNGSNYGKKTAEWQPVSLATHPNCFLDKNTLIFTKSGYKKLIDIKLGELVLTHTGKFKKIINTIQSDYINEEGYKITYNYKNKVRMLYVTKDHKFLTQRGWIKAKDLKKSDKLTKMLKPCEICGKAIETELHSKSINKTCSKKCFNKLMKKQVTNYHKNLTENEKLKRSANCSTGMRQAYENGNTISHFSKNYWTPEKKLKQKYLIESRMKQMLETSAKTRISKKQKLVYGWLLNEFPNEILQLEYNVGKYAIDIVFVKHKIGIEIDGIYHTEERREKHDKPRDAWLESKGWTILRFGYKLENNDTKKVIIPIVKNILYNHNNNYTFEFTEIVNIKKTTTGSDMKLYSVTVEDDESMISKGIVSHNCRDSQLIELKPGWKILPGGNVTFISLEKWKDYILDKVVA